MDKENRALNTILIIEIILIFFFSYGAVPTHDVDPSSHRISQRIHQKTAHTQEAADTEAEESDSHESAGEMHAAVTHEQAESEEIEETADAVEHPADEAEEHAAVKPSAHQEEKAAEEPAAKAAGGGKMPDVIAMNNSAYSKHTKGIVMFTHQKHVKDFKIGCGDCHHDESGTPLELSAGDSVEGCIECHSETKKPKGEKLSKEESIAKYHKEALHANCVGCHKTYNIEHGDPKGKKPAPTSCGKCHPKK